MYTGTDKCVWDCIREKTGECSGHFARRDWEALDICLARINHECVERCGRDG